MTVSEAAALAATTSSRQPGAPQMLHHVTYVTYDSEATTDFYTRIMGMPLVCTVMDDHLPSTGDRTPYFHTFFRLGDGSTVAFFESPGLPPAPPLPDQAFDNFQHLALSVPSKEHVDAWKEWLEANGIEVQLVDHKIIYSLYFHDPNGVRLEITTTVVGSWQDDREAAAAAVQAWIDVKRRASASGDDVDDRLRDLIADNAHQAQIRREREQTAEG